LARHTGQDSEKIRQDIDRDFWMSSEEAKEYGIIDEVLQTSELATAGVGGDGSKG
jgi:ATP-dependent Clp protease protease subunit